MQLMHDRPRPVQQPATADEPSRQWFTGPAAAERPLNEGHEASYSFASACECPDDCPRDHDRE